MASKPGLHSGLTGLGALAQDGEEQGGLLRAEGLGGGSLAPSSLGAVGVLRILEASALWILPEHTLYLFTVTAPCPDSQDDSLPGIPDVVGASLVNINIHRSTGVYNFQFGPPPPSP